MLREARLKIFEFVNVNNHNNHSANIFPVLANFSPVSEQNSPVFSLSGKSKNQIPCFPCAVATLLTHAHRHP